MQGANDRVGKDQSKVVTSKDIFRFLCPVSSRNPDGDDDDDNSFNYLFNGGIQTDISISIQSG